MAPTLDADLELALQIVTKVDNLTLQRFRAADLVVETKPDLTPVSDADKAAEHLIRSELASWRPGDAIFGEEEGGSLEHTGRRWIIDPIDGTKNYVRGVPVWATLLALEENSEILLGVVSAPALGRRWWAAQGHGAFTSIDPLIAPHEAGADLSASPRRIHVSGVSNLSDSSFSYSSLSGWHDRGKRDNLLRLMDTCWRTRAYGDFWSYMLVAEGAVDIAAEPELEIYDMAALVPIVCEAGGTFTSLAGTPGPWGGNALASNGALHDPALALLGDGARSEATNLQR
ncbi:histidinol-phosphatase [Arcanobacterium haemolyticum]|nr:histidinol-phosphatase [Arcanobacterium haemolyticum]